MPLQLHNAISWVLVLLTLAAVGFWLPANVVDEKGLPAIGGASYLIFFFHFPSAVNCLNFFMFAGVLAGIDLWRGQKDPRGELRTVAAVEVGVVACAVTLVTGSIWAKAAWNVFWEFRDSRLMTVAIMELTYLGYLALRASAEESATRARFSAVFAVIAAINVPIVYYSIKIWGRVLHPMPSADLFGATEMKVTQWFGALAFLVLYIALWRIRCRIAWARRECDRIDARLVEAGV
jgi:heme exporter protein C